MLGLAVAGIAAGDALGGEDGVQSVLPAGMPYEFRVDWLTGEARIGPLGASPPDASPVIGCTKVSQGPAWGRPTSPPGECANVDELTYTTPIRESVLTCGPSNGCYSYNANDAPFGEFYMYCFSTVNLMAVSWEGGPGYSTVNCYHPAGGSLPTSWTRWHSSVQRGQDVGIMGIAHFR
jgi:hypothetical protein